MTRSQPISLIAKLLFAELLTAVQYLKHIIAQHKFKNFVRIVTAGSFISNVLLNYFALCCLWILAANTYAESAFVLYRRHIEHRHSIAVGNMTEPETVMCLEP